MTVSRYMTSHRNPALSTKVARKMIEINIRIRTRTERDQDQEQDEHEDQH